MLKIDIDNKKIEDYLVEKNILSKEVSENLKKRNLNVEKFLVDNHILEEEELAKLKSDYYKMPYVDLSEKKIGAESLQVIPKEVAENYNIICFDRNGNDLSIAIADPSNFKAIEAIDFLAKENNFKVNYFTASEITIDLAIKQYQTLFKEVHKILDIADEERASEL